MNKRRARVRWIATAIGVALFALTIARSDLQGIVAACEQGGAWLVPLLLAPAVGLLLHTAGWWTVVPAAQRPSFFRALLAYQAAQSVDDIALGVAGEPLKVLALPSQARREGWPALVVDNVAQLFSNVAFLALMLGAWIRPSAGWVLVGAAALGGAAMVALGAAGLLPLRPSGEAPRGLLMSAVTSVTRTAARAATCLREEPWRLAASTALHFAGKAWMMVEIWIALRAAGMDGAAAVVRLSAAASVGALLGASIPGQLGALEAAYGAAGAMAGLPVASVTAVALLRRARSLPWLAAGLVLARRIADESRSGNGSRNRSDSDGWRDDREPVARVAPTGAGESGADASLQPALLVLRQGSERRSGA